MKKLLIWLLSGLCALALVGLAAAGHFASQPSYRMHLTLAGERSLTLEYTEEFTDPGASAQCTDAAHPDLPPEQVPVTVEGAVDTSVLGTYRLKYTASAQGRVATAYRDVRVVDTTAPVIELTADPDGYTLPGHAYEEEGFAALDGYDGDLTDRVIRQERDGTVVYTVTDSSGNTASVTRTIVYDDPIAPEMKLLGGEKLTLTVGSAFSDPGCKASDNVDGDITGRIKVSGSVNVYLPGTYKLTYSVSDEWGNTSSATRVVTVKAKTVASSAVTVGTPNGKNIYLTFDDGPSAHTARLLDVLKKYGVKATFFVVNTKYISLVGRIAAEGHTVALHSATHNFSSIYTSEKAYFTDLEKLQGIVEGYTGVKSMLLRFPGGSSNTVSASYSRGIMTRLTTAVKAQGYRYFDWNVDSNDAGGATTADRVFYNVIKGVSEHTNSIVLQHDTKSYSVDAVERIIRWGLENGYSFQALTDTSLVCEHKVKN